MTRTLLTRLEYDGTEFAGWQSQAPGARTVQGAVEDALARVTGARVAVIGASRTDAGVHAEGQAASLDVSSRLGPEELLRALNAVLPPDVAVRAIEPRPAGFHARHDARSKLYRYAIWNGPTRSPLRARRFLAAPGALDLGAMREAAARLAGTHDFRSFQVRASEWLEEGRSHGTERSSVRTLQRVDVEGEAGAEIFVELEGDGFLRQMVRSVVGTLLEVGRGRRSARSMEDLLAARDRSEAGPTAAAHGLTLVRVEYPALGPVATSESAGIPGR